MKEVDDEDSGLRGSLGGADGVAGGTTVAEFAALQSVGLAVGRPVVASYAVRLASVGFPCNVSRTVTNRTSRYTTSPAYYRQDDRDYEVPELVTALRRARDEVVRRLQARCAEVGADGVIGVVVEQHLQQRATTFAGYGLSALLLRLRLTGTAVRIVSGRMPKAPFLCTTSGTDTALLLRSGLAPTRIAWGFGVNMRHGYAPGRLHGGCTAPDAELPALTGLVTAARSRARADVAAQAAGATLSVLDWHQTQLLEREPIENHTHVFAVTTMTGSAAVRVGPSSALPAVPVLGLR